MVWPISKRFVMAFSPIVWIWILKIEFGGFLYVPGQIARRWGQSPLLKAFGHSDIQMRKLNNQRPLLVVGGQLTLLALYTFTVLTPTQNGVVPFFLTWHVHYPLLTTVVCTYTHFTFCTVFYIYVILTHYYLYSALYHSQRTFELHSVQWSPNLRPSLAVLCCNWELTSPCVNRAKCFPSYCWFGYTRLFSCCC